MVEGFSCKSGKTTPPNTQATYINSGAEPSVEEGHYVTAGPMSQDSMRRRETGDQSSAVNCVGLTMFMCVETNY